MRWFTRGGQGVRIEGLGIYYPTINLKGELTISHRIDPGLKSFIGAPGIFRGRIANRGNIGLTADELVALWNADHPDDPIE